MSISAALKEELAGRYSSIKEFSLPEKVDIGSRAPFSIEGHLDSEVDWPNFAIGIFYIDGPADELTVTVEGREFKVSRNMGVVKYAKPREGELQPCLTLTMSGDVLIEEEGSYRLSAMTGWFDEENNVLYYDDKIDKTLEGVTPGLPWWIIALAGGAAAIAVVGGVVAYQERRREEELIMALLARR